jgi:hypothetical protein
MKMKRVLCIIICVVSLAVLTACGMQDVSRFPSEKPQGQNVGQGSSQSGVQMEAPLTIDLDTIGEIKNFFDMSSTVSGEKTISNCYHYTDAEAEALSVAANKLFIPVVKEKEYKLGAEWAPGYEQLEIIYRVDDIQYRFMYFFADHYPWTFDEPVAEDVQAGPYLMDFKTVDPTLYADTVYFGGTQIEGTSVYLAVRIAGYGVETPSLEDFEFIPLSSADENIVE